MILRTTECNRGSGLCRHVDGSGSTSTPVPWSAYRRLPPTRRPVSSREPTTLVLPDPYATRPDVSPHPPLPPRFPDPIRRPRLPSPSPSRGSTYDSPTHRLRPTGLSGSTHDRTLPTAACLTGFSSGRLRPTRPGCDPFLRSLPPLNP